MGEVSRVQILRDKAKHNKIFPSIYNHSERRYLCASCLYNSNKSHAIFLGAVQSYVPYILPTEWRIGQSKKMHKVSFDVSTLTHLL